MSISVYFCISQLIDLEDIVKCICLPNAYLRFQNVFMQMAAKHYNTLLYFLVLEINNKDQNLPQLKIL